MTLRSFDTDLPIAVLDRVQDGVLTTKYRGVSLLKSPFDLVLYLQLIGRLLPATVIEIGCKQGGSALWFADMLTVHGVQDPRVLSVDIAALPTFTDPRISFIQGDAKALEEALPPERLAECRRPFLVVEDSSHFYAESAATLEFFHPALESGDYIVVEDGVVAHLSAAHYRRYENGPTRAIADFLERRGEHYELDTSLCDFYGRNVTYNPNGWLRRL